MKNKNWYPVDNVSFLYSVLKNKKRQNVFRFSCELKDDIDKDYLQIALRETLKVYDNFHINLKVGAFSYYFETSIVYPKVYKESRPICHKILYNDKDLLYEVSFFNNRINLEVSHILCDAQEGMKFFKMLVSNYVKYYYNESYIKEERVTSELGAVQDDLPSDNKEVAELTNNYKNVFKYGGDKYRYKTRFYELHCDLSGIIDLANRYNTELPTFLISLIIFSMLAEFRVKDTNKRIKIELPVDLRTFSEANASQNCFDIFYVDYDPACGKLQFTDIIESVALQLKSRDTSGEVGNHLNVSFQKFISAKGSPLFIKKVGMDLIYKNVSRRRSLIYSNVGTLIFDENIEEYIKSVSLLSSTSDMRFTLISNKNDLCIGISSVYKYNNVLRNFIKLLNDTGLKMYINTEVC